ELSAPLQCSLEYGLCGATSPLDRPQNNGCGVGEFLPLFGVYARPAFNNSDPDLDDLDMVRLYSDRAPHGLVPNGTEYLFPFNEPTNDWIPESGAVELMAFHHIQSFMEESFNRFRTYG